MTVPDWHKKLFDHFAVLQSKRQLDIPIFAIEHDLDEDELIQLKTDLLNVLKLNQVPNDVNYLPWVVYCTERGYEYSGDDYWPTFKEKTDNWVDNHHNRNFIKNCFLRFEKDFRAVVPTGDWATHFNIISRPIINSILPKDIQFSLLRILIDISFSLTKIHLEDINLLGKKIQENSWNSNSRFQTFAQNTALLGQFTRALLDSSSNLNSLLISEKTFARIEFDLSSEEKNKIFLTRIREKIKPLKLSGIRTRPFTGDRENIEDFYSGNNKILSVKPSFYLSPCEDNSWNIILHIPVMTFILKWSAKFTKLLNEGRVNIPNSDKSNPFPAKNLLYHDNEFNLLKWPDINKPLIEFAFRGEVQYEINLENIYENTELFCFYLANQNEAVYVSHKMLESDKSYIFLYNNLKIDEFLKDCDEIPLNCKNIKARKVEIKNISLNVLNELGFNVLRNISFKPIAYPTSNNDYVGVYEYSLRENPTFILISDTKINKLKLELYDNQLLYTIELIDINPNEKKIIQLSSLKVGNYSLKMETEIFHENALLHTNGLIEIYIRDEENSSQKIQTPLQFFVSPNSPSLEDFWEMKCRIKILGPKNYNITPEISLLDKNSQIIYNHRLSKTKLPIEENSWSEQFLNFRRNNNRIGTIYENTYSSILSFSEPNLGSVKQIFERSFVPIRWMLKHSNDGYWIKLITGSENFDKINIYKYDFKTPNTKHDLIVEQFMQFNATEKKGGLYLAESENVKIGFVAPPLDTKTLQDLIIPVDNLNLPRNTDDIIKIIDIINLWSSARQSGSQLAFLNQVNVYYRLTESLFRSICGDKWVKQEKAIIENLPLQFIKYKLIPLLNNQRIEKYLNDKFENILNDFVESDIVDKVEFLQHMLSNLYIFREFKYFKKMYESYNMSLTANFILKLASSPQNLMDFDKSMIDIGIKCILEHPILLRIARVLVIYSIKINRSFEDNIYWGWKWN